MPEREIKVKAVSEEVKAASKRVVIDRSAFMDDDEAEVKPAAKSEAEMEDRVAAMLQKYEK